MPRMFIYLSPKYKYKNSQSNNKNHAGKEPILSKTCGTNFG